MKSKHETFATALSKRRAWWKEHLPVLLILMLASIWVQPSYGWQNGSLPAGAGGCSKCYGTHDFLADHALSFVPYERVYSFLMASGSMPYGVFANEEYLYGTEIPDQGAYGFKQDWRLHSVYYSPDGKLVDDYAAKRAQESFEQVLFYLRIGDKESAAKWMGITSHYVSDVTSYWHVMGPGDEWVDLAKNGLYYENWVEGETYLYGAPFASCMSFDGSLEHISAYNVTLKLAYDTTFDPSGPPHPRTARWMDDHFDAYSPYYLERVCQSLNLAANAIADLIYSTAQPEIETTTSIATPITVTQPVVSTVTLTPVTVTTTLLSVSSVTTIVSTESMPGVGTMLPIAVSIVLAILLLWVLVRSRWKPASRSSAPQDTGNSVRHGETP